MANVGRPRGYQMSVESRRAISDTKTGSKHTEETKKRISDAVNRRTTSISIERIMATDLDDTNKVKVGGYISIYIPSDGISKGNNIRYHVAIMEQELGRKLIKGEDVHHWGDKLNNMRCLLTLCSTRKEHKRLDRVKKNLKQTLENYKNKEY